MHHFGILSFNHLNEKDYFTGLARYGFSKSVRSYLLNPDKMDVEKGTAIGLVYSPESDDWYEQEFQIPEILYDRLYYRNEQELKSYFPVISRLKSNSNYIFLGYGLPDKWMMYVNFRKNPHVKPYLPETKLVTDSRDVSKMLDNQTSLILKPLVGAQGRGIYLITKKNDSILVQTIKEKEKIEKEMNKEQFLIWTKKLLSFNSYLVQPFLPLRDKFNRAFDIRIFYQRDEAGKWQERVRGLRVGKDNFFLSNLSAGGSIHPYDTWKADLPKEMQIFMDQELADLVRLLLDILDSDYPPLFEVGFDFGIGQDGKVWLLEVNSKPGRTVAKEISPDLLGVMQRATIHYALTLLEHGKEPRRNEKGLPN